MYYSNSLLSGIYKDALKTFEDVSSFEKELSVAESLIKANFEGKTGLPSLGLHVSGFKENIIVLDDYISVSTDKYLGEDYPMYSQFFESYQRLQMQPKMITRDILRAWILSERKNTNKRKDLLEEMLDEGKTIYILSVLLPEWKKNDLIGYSTMQEEWCKTNEKNIWKTILQKNYLFNKEYLIIERFISDAPYTQAISTDSPGRLGAWVGWQIVDSYVKESKVSVSDLLGKDATTILKESKYNPQ